MLKRVKKRPILMVVLLLVFLGSYFGLFNNTSSQFMVLGVADGDTILVDMYGKTETVRLIGVDTPETHHPSKPVQCYGPEASDYTEQLASGENVTLLADPLSDNRDVYDRLLRYVVLDDKTVLNESLVEQGFGFAVTGFEHSHLARYVQLERQAEQSGAGLWQSCQINTDSGYKSTNPNTDLSE